MPCGLIGMYWVKCKQTEVYQRYVYILFCLTVIRPWLKLPTGGHGHVICMGNLRGVFSQENTPEGHTETHKSKLFPYKQVSGRNGDHEWLRMTNAFILSDLVWKVQKSHAANREGSFNKYVCFLPAFEQTCSKCLFLGPTQHMTFFFSFL